MLKDAQRKVWTDFLLSRKESPMITGYDTPIEKEIRQQSDVDTESGMISDREPQASGPEGDTLVPLVNALLNSSSSIHSEN